jgi:pantothenate kinase type III
LAAGLVIAALTGVAGALALIALTYLGQKPSLAIDVGSAITFVAVAGLVYGLGLGAVPGMLVMSLSWARARPWHALPYVLIGTIAGVIVSELLALHTSFGSSTETIAGVEALFVFAIPPTIGGIIAAWLWSRYFCRSR